MKPLYESILSTTKSGKEHRPFKFSKEYTRAEVDDAIEDYYDFYKRKNHYFDIKKLTPFEDASYENLMYILNNYAYGDANAKFSFVMDLEFYKKFSRCEKELEKSGRRFFSPYSDFEYVWIVKLDNRYFIWDGNSISHYKFFVISKTLKDFDLV
jgi:hypothetical protein